MLRMSGCAIALSALAILWGNAIVRADDRLDVAKVTEVVALIKGIPDWPLSPIMADDDDREAVAKNAWRVEVACGSIAAYESDVVREAMATILRAKPTTRDRQAMFFLCLYLFDVPASIRDVPPEKRFYVQGGCSPLPVSARTSTIWPWCFVEGQMRFDTAANGLESFARPYPALEAFDYLREKFGRRKTGD
jgi:hypothetical protein